MTKEAKTLGVALAASGLLCNHVDFHINFSISVKNSIGILMRIALNV